MPLLIVNGHASSLSLGSTIDNKPLACVSEATRPRGPPGMASGSDPTKYRPLKIGLKSYFLKSVDIPHFMVYNISVSTAKKLRHKS
jgi:hypothetical protein